MSIICQCLSKVLGTILTGTDELLSKHGAMATTIIIDKTQEEEEGMTTSSKDTGGKRRIQKWMRGVWFCVSRGGHIQMWQPLYQYVYTVQS